MNPIMLGDFSARSRGMSVADFLYLQHRPTDRLRRARRSTRVRRRAQRRTGR
ncbi:hypothetical protein [Georgenia faecalis]|uniref:Uncharacterized protein n=1 Tax=Georgenia faecalis TaxID=2483799 RepID=A0ABV9DC89_9MICO|nr:hypothetical protein [Georgenia faecalis]